MNRNRLLCTAGLGLALLGTGYALHVHAGDALRFTGSHAPTLGPPNATPFSGKKVHKGGKRPQGRPR